MPFSSNVFSFCRLDDASHEIENHGKRTRSVTLIMMLEELASVKKESREAMDEIEASKVKTVSGMENEVLSGKAKGVFIGEESVGGSAKGNVKGHASFNPGGTARNSYHASIYRLSESKR